MHFFFINFLDQIFSTLRAFFKNYDIILSPVLFKPPLLIGEQGSHKSFEDVFASVNEYVAYTAQYNASGNPSISLPLYTSPAAQQQDQPPRRSAPTREQFVSTAANNCCPAFNFTGGAGEESTLRTLR